MLTIHAKGLKSCVMTLVIGAALITVDPGKQLSGNNAFAEVTTLTLLTKNAYPDGGYTYIVTQRLGTVPDSGSAPVTSKLRLFENGKELGPSHSLHADIRNLGNGRFSHWGRTTEKFGVSKLYFSASDNTDPRTNGRSYTYQIDSQSVPAPPIPLAIGISVPAGTTLPALATTTVVIKFTTGMPTSVMLARGPLTSFAQWPTGTLSEYFTRTASGLNFNLCLAPNCVASGPVTLTATAVNAAGQSASASTTITIASTTPPPATVSAPVPVVTPAPVPAPAPVVIPAPTPVPAPPTALAVGISVPAGSTLSASDTTTVVINFITGSPTSVTLGRGSLTAFAQWPTGTLSGYFTRTASGLNFNLCLAPNCVASGPVTLTATAVNAAGQSASASTTITIGSTTPTPPAPAPAPAPASVPAPAPEQLKTDLGVYYEPALPAMGPAGSKVVDPTFGTTILRVTDASDGPDCIAPYTYYPNFNLNSTRLYAQCGNNAVFFSFNPTTMAVSGKRVAPSIGAQAYGMVWSGTNPDVIYMNTNTALVSYNVATNTYTTIRNFSAEIAGNGASHIAQMSVSHDDDMFAWSLGSSGGHTGYLVWKKSTNTFLMNSLDGQADEVHVDKSGRYLTIQKVDGRPTVWDLATKTMTQLGSFDGGTGFYHMDTGTGTLMSGYASGLGYRHLATPNTVTSVLAGFSFGNMHYSMNANNEQWALVWAQRNDTLSNTKPFDNEVLQVATDGSGRVRRIAHHRSKWNDYYDQPNANISPDGQFVAFCSNWGNANGRRDVYVVKIPPASTN